MERFVRDLSYGLRSLWARKGFSLVVVLTLGLAIGVNTTLFSLVKTVLFASLQFADPDAIVFLWSRNEAMNRVREPSSYPDFVDLRQGLESFQDLAAWTRERRALTGSVEPVHVEGGRATASFFAVTGVSLSRGRVFSEGEESVAVVSYGIWERQFGSDPEVIGRTVDLDGEAHTVIGVLAREMETAAFGQAEVWTPLRLGPADLPRDDRRFYVVGRLAPGVTLEDAASEVESFSRQISEQYPLTSAGWSVFAQPFLETIMGPNVKTIALLLSLTVGFVLLIGCANVAHLMMARGETRRRELRIRQALGASRAQILRQLLTESLVLSTLGSIAGLALTSWTIRALEATTRSRVPLFTRVEADSTVLGFILVMAFLTPLLFGLLPAWNLSRATLSDRGASRRSKRPRQVLVAGEVALSLVLLVVAGLATASIRAIRDIELGFRKENVLTMVLEAPAFRVPNEEGAARFFEDVHSAVAALPSVSVVSLSSQRPIEGSGPNQSFRIAGRPEPESDLAPSAATVVVSSRFFETLSIEVLEGRDFLSTDTDRSKPVAIVSRAARERYWPGESPLGEQIRLEEDRVLNPSAARAAGDSRSERPWGWGPTALMDEPALREVVGVVSDIRNSDADQPAEPHIYLPYTQHNERAMSLLVRAQSDPLRLVPSVRAAIREIDPAQPIEDIRTMEQIVYDDLSSDFALVGLMGYFTLVALGLAAAGIYGVVSHSVSERSREIGIRMAIGAEARQVLVMILRQGMLPVAVGLLVGAVVSLGFSRFMTALVYGISVTDLATYAWVTISITSIAFGASLVPALRAARTDPISTLRAD